jgi:hypothetical protein
MLDARRRPRFTRLVATLVLILSVAPSPAAWAASHREAPLIALDPTADLTDVYAFRSWQDPSKAVFIMNVIPAQVPGSGPNFFTLDDQVLYAFHLDLDQDGNAGDVSIEFRFSTEVRGPATDFPVSYAALGPIVALDGPGSEGLGLRQRYSVRAVDRVRTPLSRALAAAIGSTQTAVGGPPLVAVPSNVGPRTMPDYEGLAAQGVFDLGGGLRVFVGPREETFYIDLGSTFDTLNFRRDPPVLTDAEDADDTANAFGVDDGFEGLNVTSIALEVPIALLPPVVGVYASTGRLRSRFTMRDAQGVKSGQFRQVARLANPLVNEVIIPTARKDDWNAQDPRDEAQFVEFYRNPRLATVLNLLFCCPPLPVAIPDSGRTDLVAVLLQYPGDGGRLADLLRLDLSVPPTPPAAQKRLTVLAHDAAGAPTPDPAGWPNGRRPNDDVTDVALRVVAGVLLPCCGGAPYARLGDGVNVNRLRVGTPNVSAGNNVSTAFPFLPTPNPGRSPSPPLTDGPSEPLFR